MTEIRVITYAEGRESFFEKKLKQADRALDNVVKYGTDPYACDEKGEIVAFYRDALAALREKAARGKGCDYCGFIYKLDCESYGTVSDIIDNKFCPMCGRRLEVKHG